MKKLSIVRQTFFLTLANALVRCMGFVLRIWLSRVLGAEALGVMELASSAHMLWLSPVTSGLPLAVSRETAAGRGREALSSGLRLALRISLPLMTLLFLLLPLISRFLGDIRTLPALAVYLPCLPVLAVSAVVNGACYGSSNTVPPAASELLEQALRLLLCFFLLCAFPSLSAAFSAAVPPLATLLGEICGLILVYFLLRRAKMSFTLKNASSSMEKTLFKLSLPLTGIRISATLMRSVSAVMTPLRLQAFGLSLQEATARLGMLTGMAMPLVMLPGIFTGALSMVSAPAITRRESEGRPLRPLMFCVLTAALLIGLSSALLLFLLAPYLALYLYRTPDVNALLRALTPLCPLLSLHQVVSGMLAGLGKQRSSLTASLAGSLLHLLLLYVLSARMGLFGCIAAQIAGHGLTLLLDLHTLLGVLFSRLTLRQEPPPRSPGAQ